MSLKANTVCHLWKEHRLLLPCLLLTHFLQRQLQVTDRIQRCLSRDRHATCLFPGLGADAAATPQHCTTTMTSLSNRPATACMPDPGEEAADVSAACRGSLNPTP